MQTPSVAIHVVDHDNASLLDRVDEDVFDYPVRPELLRAFLENPANLLVVAVTACEVVGMATGIAYLHPDKPLSLFINEVGVSGRFRRRGIGRNLVTALIARGRELGCVEAWVATEQDNKAARALYQSLGGEQDDQYAVVYTYPLSEQPLSGQGLDKG